MHAYCLHCETQKCASVAQRIGTQYGYRCIYPTILQRIWIKGECREQPRPWLEGYVFVYTDEPVERFFRVDGVIRWLGKDELHGPDRAFADLVLRQGGVQGPVSLAKEGDRCTLSDPAWEHMSGTVVKVDRGRKRCRVEFSFDGVKRAIWVGYEMVEKSEGVRPEGEEASAADNRQDRG